MDDISPDVDGRPKLEPSSVLGWKGGLTRAFRCRVEKEQSKAELEMSSGGSVWMKPLPALVNTCGLLRPFGSFPITFFHDQGLHTEATWWTKPMYKSIFRTLTDHQWPGGSCYNADSGSLGLGWALKVCISNQFPGDTNVAGPRSSRRASRPCTSPVMQCKALKQQVAFFWFFLLPYSPAIGVWLACVTTTTC